MSEIKVSVLCITYNHQKYIAKALQSIVDQKTNFKFELIVHDDASTDSTADIIKEYALKYPEIITPIFQTENQYSKGEKITSRFLFPYAKGEYLAFLEGDDYWVDENKLQTQVDELEKNNTAHACAHYTQCKNSQNKIVGYFPPKDKDLTTKILDVKDAFKRAVNGELHTSSLMVKSDLYKSYVKEFLKKTKGLGFGDIPLYIYVTSKTDLLFIDKVMSNYNVGTDTSYMKSVFSSRKRSIEHYRKSTAFFREIYKSCKLIYQQKIIKERLETEEYLLQTTLLNYKFIFDKNNRHQFKKLSFKHRLKLRIGRFFPGLVEKHEKKRDN